MPSPYNITNIPAPRVDFIDPRTGLMAREWYRFFFNLFNLTGAGTTDTSLADLQVGPPAINEVLGELGITYDQAQLAAMMSQYEQATRDIQNQLDTAPAAPQLGTLSTYNEDNVRLIGFDTSPSPAVPNPAPTGTLYWDGNSTLGLQMNQSVLVRIGQAQFVYAKASSAITKGQLCKHTGAIGASGVITAAPTSTNMTDTTQIIGVAAQDIALNDFGFIQVAGDLRGFDTTGSSVGEVWADGDSLYYNPSFVGNFTKNKPSAPNLKTYIGEIINAGSGGSGSINIHLIYGSTLGGSDSNVQFGTLADKDLIQYDSIAQYWKNVAPSTISIGTATNLAGGAAGSVPYQTGAGATTFLPIGTATQVLKVNAGATSPEWVSGAALSKVDDTNVTLTLGGSPATSLLAATSLTLGWTGTLAVSRGGTGTGTAFTPGSVVFAGASGVYSQNNANLFWDDANNRLGIGTVTPGSTLDVAGTLNVTGNAVLGNATTDSVTVSGYMGVAGGTAFSTAAINVDTTSLTGISQRGIRSRIVGTSAATFRIAAFNALTGTEAAVFTAPDVIGYAAFDSTKGAGSTITNLYGVLVYDQTQGDNNFGVASQVSSGANKWNIYASGTANNAFAGNVRIGSTTAPTVPLDVTGAAAFSTSATTPVVIGGTGTTSTLTLRSTSGVGTTGADIVFQVGNNGATEAMRVLNSGNVAIGATSATFRLDVTSAAVNGDVAAFRNTAATNALIAFSDNTPTNVGPRFGSAGNNLVFLTNTSGSAAERMRLTGAGYLGLGTTAPARPLHVASVDPGMFIDRNAGNPGVLGLRGARGALASPTQSLANDYLGSLGGFGYTDATAFTSTAIANINFYAAENLTSTAQGSYITLSTTATGTTTLSERMRIDSAGNVGIGATPAARLHLAGALTAAAWTTNGIGVRVAAATYTDSSTAASGTVASSGVHAIAQPTIASTNATVTYTDAATLYIANSPANGTNVTVTNPWSMWVAAGNARFDGNLLLKGATSALGYGTGSGGAVTQITSRTTGVTLDKTNGAITLVSAAGTTTWQTFTVTNNKVAATDTIIVNQKSGTDLYQIFVTNVAAGSFKITFATTGGTTTEQPVFNFAVIKAVTS